MSTSIDKTRARKDCGAAALLFLRQYPDPHIAAQEWRAEAERLLAALALACTTLLDRDDWHLRSARELAARVVAAEERVMTLEALSASLSGRCAAQAELLARRAEGVPT